MNDFKWLFVSEIKGIQEYILATDKLKHMVGASEIIASITDREFYDEKVLKTLNCEYDKDYKVMMAAAGRLMLLFKDEAKIKDLMAVWSIVINEYAPGVELVYDYFTIDSNNLQETRKKALEKMTSRRQQQNCSLPIPSLPVERCRRDGLAAVGIRDEERISKEIKRKLDGAKESRSKIIDKVIPELNKYDTLKELFPTDFQEITGTDDKTYMAIVHIDVNSMGSFFIDVGKNLEKENIDNTLKIYQGISKCLLESAKTAAKKATGTIFKYILEKEEIQKSKTEVEMIPFRPLVLAGDDFTFVIKSPYAVRYSEKYIEEFNNEAKKQLAKIIKEYNLSISDEKYDFKLSAGITFTKSKFPFKTAYGLCEKLCKMGKELSKRNVSTISFYRQTTAASDDLEILLNREFQHDKLEMTYKTYALGSNNENLPSIKDLESIISALYKLPRGSLRKIASKLFSDKNTVDMFWKRFISICQERNSQVYEILKKSLIKITKNTETPLWEKTPDGNYKTPLIDAINLYSVNSNFEDRSVE